MDVERRRLKFLPPTVIVVFVLLWTFWCAIYTYLYIYIPHWQQEQSVLLEEAIKRDCSLTFVVTPASIYPAIRPYWSRPYPPTGKDIECRLEQGRGANRGTEIWECTRCGRQ